VEILEFVERSGIKKKEFAKLLGITPGALANYMYKRREPRAPIRQRIIKITKGIVTLEDLLKK
jgi:predicted transcriptional regulator